MAIINNSFQFIFVHVPKAAGTSVTSVLSPFTNYCDLEIGGTQFGEQIQPAYQRRFGLAKHTSAAKIRNIVGTVVWSKYFTFSFVRNPFARCLSVFHFLRKWEDVPGEIGKAMKAFSSFEEYVLSDIWEETQGPDQIFRPQLYWLGAGPHSTEPIVDFVGRVENIDEDLVTILEAVGLRKKVMQLSAAPKLNQSRLNQSKHLDETDLANEQVVEKIVRKYRVDFDALGYSLDPSSLFDSVSSKNS
jgi:hypothetical protein